jgi:hypothetical protein
VRVVIAMYSRYDGSFVQKLFSHARARAHKMYLIHILILILIVGIN